MLGRGEDKRGTAAVRLQQQQKATDGQLCFLPGVAVAARPAPSAPGAAEGVSFEPTRWSAVRCSPRPAARSSRPSRRAAQALAPSCGLQGEKPQHLATHTPRTAKDDLNELIMLFPRFQAGFLRVFFFLFYFFLVYFKAGLDRTLSTLIQLKDVPAHGRGVGLDGL